MTRGALVHEWIAPHGGSENVFEQIVQTFPDADLHCLWSDAPQRFAGRFTRETWLAGTPLRRTKAGALLFMPMAWRGLKGGPYDWALISSHAFAHHASFANVTDGFRKFVYVHTPARYLWARDLDQRGAGLLARIASPALKRLDRHRAAEPARIAANSVFIRQRIRRSWDLDADVIYPPVDIETIQSVSDWRTELSPEELRTLQGLPRDFVLGASRFIPYKRLDLAIRAAEVAGLPAVIAGAGPLEQALRQLAGDARIPVTFVIAPSSRLLYAIYQRASVFVFPAVEDFGIMPIESIACGTPAVVSAAGGAREGVQACGGGAVLEEHSNDAWKSALDAAAAVDRTLMREQAARFGQTRFRREISSWLAKPWAGNA